MSRESLQIDWAWKSKDLQARGQEKPTMHQWRGSPKSPPWKRHLATSNFIQGLSWKQAWQEVWKHSTFLLVALPCIGENGFREFSLQIDCNLQWPSKEIWARPKKKHPYKRKSAKSPPWKRDLATGDFTEKSQLETSVPVRWNSTFLLVALPCKCENTCRGVLFANWLQLAMALKENLKTFKLHRKKSHDVPKKRVCKISTIEKAPCNGQLHTKVSARTQKQVCWNCLLLFAAKEIQTLSKSRVRNRLQFAMGLPGNLKTFKLQMGACSEERSQQASMPEAWKSSTFFPAALHCKGAPNTVNVCVESSLHIDCNWSWPLTEIWTLSG